MRHCETITALTMACLSLTLSFGACAQTLSGPPLLAALQGGGYSVDHSAETYVLDAHRNLIGRINIDEPDATLLPKLRRLLAQ